MPTLEIVEQTYDAYELMVLQAHVDFYRLIPEARSLTGFSMRHQLLCANACERLAKRGMLTIQTILSEIVWKTIDIDPSDELYQLALTHGQFERVDLTNPPLIRFITETKFPGFQARLTEESVPEVVRLFKAGIIKKND
ncbi:MAG: hypothetical protein K8Q97_01515 [Candidatus Andersenbacteria bacterium]|nr:hypothetical protein [Candidatus Andersenbacteria bacterium]